jgi:hypothetical protein
MLRLNGRCDMDTEQVDLGEPHRGASMTVIKDVIKNKPVRKGRGSRARPARLFRKAV